MQIFVTTLQGKTITLDIEECDSIAAAKVQIHSKVGLPPAQQRLVFSGKQLEDNFNFAHYDIEKGATVHLLLRLSGGAQLFVKTLTGKTIVLDVEGSDTVRTVKELLQSREGVSVELQRLIVAGKQMEDGRCLADYCLPWRELTVHLVVRRVT